MAPDRQSDLAQVAFRAFVAGSAACFMTACIAGERKFKGVIIFIRLNIALHLGNRYAYIIRL